jgi:hypothetical protein
MGHYASEIDPDWGLSKEEIRQRFHQRAADERECEVQIEARIRTIAVPAIGEMEQMEGVSEDMGIIVCDVAWWCDEHDVDYGHSKTLISHVLHQLVFEGTLVQHVRGGYRLSKQAYLTLLLPPVEALGLRSRPSALAL